MSIVKDQQYYKFCFYGFLKNLRFFDAFFILFLLEKDLSYTAIGSLYAIREITINLSEIPTGILADTFGRKNALASSFILYIISFLLFYAGQDYWVFLSAFIFYGIADAFRSGTHKAMIMKYLKLNHWHTHKVDYYGHTRACSQRGAALSALVAGIIVFINGNYNTIFLISSIPYIINLFLILSYPKELNLPPKKERLSFIDTLKNTWQMLKQPQVLSIIHSAAIFTAYQKSLKDYIQPLMQKVALILPVLVGFESKKRIGLLIGIMYFILYLLTANASKFSGKIGLNKQRKYAIYTLFLGLLIGTISGLAYEYKYWYVALVFFSFIYLIENVRKPLLTGLLADEVPNKILASAISAQSLYRTLLTAVLSLLLGFSIDRFGMGKALIFVGILLLIINYIIIYSSKTKLKRKLID